MDNRHYLEAMKSSVSRNGRLERIAFAITNKRLQQSIENYEERYWKVEGEVFQVDRYLCQKMIFVRNG